MNNTIWIYAKYDFIFENVIFVREHICVTRNCYLINFFALLFCIVRRRDCAAIAQRSAFRPLLILIPVPLGAISLRDEFSMSE